MKEESARILVVDDAPNTLEVLQRNLTERGYTTYTAMSAAEAIRLLESTTIDLVITDFKMPGVSGVDLIRHVKENYRETRVMMITGYATVQRAVEAVRTGAEAYLAKPFTEEELFEAVDSALTRLEHRRAATEAPVSKSDRRHGLVWESEAMGRVTREITKAAGTIATVLILGESGTGKELVARAVHYSSDRASCPFVPVNCGGIPHELLESELFGYAKGAFTGADQTRPGFFQAADHGTIFLDEISETSPAMQVKLLRVLQDRDVMMVGSRTAHLVDVRVIAASNKDLRDLVRRNAFREDLYYRLNVLSIAIPPLRDRSDDVLVLTRVFARRFAEELGKPVPSFSDEVLDAFRRYSWPGNVRELENVIQRIIVMSDDEHARVVDLPQDMRFSAPRESGFNRTLEEVENEHILRVLEHLDGNKTRAAEQLGIDRKTLRERLRRINARRGTDQDAGGTRRQSPVS